MERFLLLWDDLDDMSAACRHMTVCAMDEVAELSGAVAAAASAFALWLLRIPN